MSRTLRFLPLGVALLCVQLDYFSLTLALPRIAAELHADVTNLQWLVSGYMLSLGALLVPAGRVGDILGRRLTLIIGLAVFAATSFVCGATSDGTVLIASRVAQGAGAALIMPVAFSLASNASSEKERPRVTGLLLGIAGFGTALGPVVGGVFASTIGWRWVFWINVPLAIVAILGVLTVQDSRDESLPRSLRSMDWLGLVAVALGLGTLSVGIDQVSDVGWVAPPALVPMVLGLLFLAAFVVVESRAAHPLVTPGLLRIRPFTALFLVGLVCNTGACIFIFTSTLELQNVRGLAPAAAGTLFVLASVGVAVSGPLAGWLCSRFRPALVLGVAAVVGGASLVGLTLAAALPAYVVALGIAGLACGMGYSATQVGIQNAVPIERNSEANSFTLMAMISLGGVAVVIGSGIVEGIGDNVPTTTGIDVVLAGMAALMLLAGVVLLAATLGRPARQTAIA